MHEQILSRSQAVCLFVLFILGTGLIHAEGTHLYQDGWIATLGGLIMAIPLIVLYTRLLTLFPGKNGAEMLRLCFGRVLGGFLTILFCLYALYTAAHALRTLSDYIQITSIPETPQYLMIFALAILSLYGVRSGVRTLGQWSIYILPLVVLVVAGTCIIGITDMDFHNLLPMFQAPPKDLIQGSFNALSSPFGETVLFLFVFDTFKPKKEPSRALYIALAITAALFMLSTLRNILILGPVAISHTLYPGYSSVRILSAGNFLTRFEALVSVNLILAGFIKICVGVFAASRALSTLLGIPVSSKALNVPLIFATAALSLWIYRTSLEAEHIYAVYPYFVLPLQLGIPTLMWLIGEFRYRRRSSHKPRLTGTRNAQTPKELTDSPSQITSRTL